MTNPLLQARSRLANATRSGDANAIAEARATFHAEKLRAAIEEHGPQVTWHDRQDLGAQLLLMVDPTDGDLL